MFGKRKEPVHKEYDREHRMPALRCSICTGEQVAGFKDKATGKFEEVTLVRDRQDLQKFLDTYGLQEKDVTKIY